MKKMILMSILIPSVGVGVTINDIPEIQQKSQQIADVSATLGNFSTYVKTLSDNGWKFNVPFSTVTFTLSVQQRQEMVNQYNDYKATLQSLSNSLP